MALMKDIVKNPGRKTSCLPTGRNYTVEGNKQELRLQPFICFVDEIKD
jgi:hypothetical protein